MDVDVLIVEDEQSLAESTSEYLRLSGLTTASVETAEEALAFLQTERAALILLDVNLPGMSGFELTKHLRERHQLPIIFVSARGSDDDQVLALSLGGDDYITKPFSLSVLLAKVKRVLARLGDAAPAPIGYDDGRLRFDAGADRFFVDEKELALTAMEHKLLRHFVRNRGRVVAKEELFREVWGDSITGDGTLTVHVRRLRTHIERDPAEPRYIRTVWGRGYIFEEPE